jgi:hypothetical protein
LTMDGSMTPLVVSGAGEAGSPIGAAWLVDGSGDLAACINALASSGSIGMFCPDSGSNWVKRVFVEIVSGADLTPATGTPFCRVASPADADGAMDFAGWFRKSFAPGIFCRGGVGVVPSSIFMGGRTLLAGLMAAGSDKMLFFELAGAGAAGMSIMV